MKNYNTDVILWINKADHDLGTAVLTRKSEKPLKQLKVCAYW